ncbi:MAG: CpsD/CapB family tyrosine-protein kinase [Chloroflexi bacterium]|nr:CpsD/CapB family tyrosine-protein kinase [Chloroflexota bacterium]MBP7042017.1 CpsD/CapB family tyrosine-protein kinase [Chloroflexota bacterium]
MKITLRKQKKEPLPPLVIPAGDGTPLQKFSGEVVDNLRYMVTRILRNGQLPSRLSMVSALRGEGVTYLSQALAATIAHDMKARICVVDLNWWWPSPAIMAANDNPGLAAVIAKEAKLDDVIAPTGWSNLMFIPAGNMAIEHRPVMARSQELQDAINNLSTRFDFLILDIPAIHSTSDAIPLASLGDACCLVVRQGITTVEDVRLGLDEIDHIPMLGVVLNRVKLATPTFVTKLIPA